MAEHNFTFPSPVRILTMLHSGVGESKYSKMIPILSWYRKNVWEFITRSPGLMWYLHRSTVSPRGGGFHRLQDLQLIGDDVHLVDVPVGGGAVTL